MPRAILPLHIFEPRYRDMTCETLKAQRLIAIALLKPGFEDNYHTLTVPVYPHVCVGRIIKSERLPDGRYNLLLEGVDRAEIQEEDCCRTYRRATLKKLTPRQSPPTDMVCDLFDEIRGIVRSSSMRTLATEANWNSIFECADISLSDAVDLLAYSALPNSECRVRFLAEPCVIKRSKIVLELLNSLSNYYENKAANKLWPPPICDN